MNINNQNDNGELSQGMRWRCIGPPRGGRVVAIAGDPSEGDQVSM